MSSLEQAQNILEQQIPINLHECSNLQQKIFFPNADGTQYLKLWNTSVNQVLNNISSVSYLFKQIEKENPLAANEENNPSTAFIDAKKKICLEYCFNLLHIVRVYINECAQKLNNGFMSVDLYNQHVRFAKESCDSIRSRVNDLLERSIKITRQPPLVILRDSTQMNDPSNQKNPADKKDVKVKKDFPLQVHINNYGLCEKIQLPGKQGRKTKSVPKVEMIMINEEDGINFMQDPHNSKLPTSSGNTTEKQLTGSKSVPCLEIPIENPDSDVWTVDLKNIRILKVDRDKSKKVSDTRCCFLFIVKLGCFGLNEINDVNELTLQTISLPFSLLSNPNQRKKTLQHVFWSRILHSLAIDLKHTDRDSVPIPFYIVKYYLNEYFCNSVMCPERLTDDQLFHLRELLLGPNVNDDAPVTLNNLNGRMANGTNIVFWEWFDETIDLILSKTIKMYWVSNFMVGYVSRLWAENYMRQNCRESTILFRFSDSVVSGLVLTVFVPNSRELFYHIVIQKEFYDKRNLVNCFKRLCEEYPMLKDVRWILCGNGIPKPINVFKPDPADLKKEDEEPEDKLHRGYWNIVRRMELRSSNDQETNVAASQQHFTSPTGSFTPQSSLTYEDYNSRGGLSPQNSLTSEDYNPYDPNMDIELYAHMGWNMDGMMVNTCQGGYLDVDDNSNSVNYELGDVGLNQETMAMATIADVLEVIHNQN